MGVLSYKSIINEKLKGHELSDDEIRRVQLALKKASEEILDVCSRYNLKLILVGGSLLGKVRHNGFIPWDDDIDFGMLRDDYNRFITIYDKELSDKYILSAPIEKYPTYNRFIQLFRKGTFVDDGGLDNPLRPKNICIDIFPLDYAPNNFFVRNIKGGIANLLMAIGGAVNTKETLTPELKNLLLSSGRGKIQYMIRMIISFFFGIIGSKVWFERIDKFIAQTKKTKFLTIAPGRKHYLGEVIPANTFLPLEKTEFEGLQVFQPSNPSAYLKNMYGDFMKLPPVEKREKHFIVKIDLGELE